MPPSTHPEGRSVGTTTYQQYGCRCDGCSEDHRRMRLRSRMIRRAIEQACIQRLESEDAEWLESVRSAARREARQKYPVVSQPVTSGASEHGDASSDSD